MIDSNKTILVVDDDLKNRMLVVDTLARFNYKLLVASDGEMALRIISKETTDLVLMDWEMPNMDGITALRQIKNQPATQDIPVIMYTGIMTSSESLQEALEVGAIDFLRKPVEKVELIARIRATLLLQESIQTRIQAERDNAILIKELKEQELVHKTKQLAGMSLQVEQSISHLNNIIRQAKSIQKDPTENKINGLQKIVNLAQKKIDQKTNFESLKTRMDSIYGGFLGRLIEKHPNLSKGELKLCSFARLNLSRKEIAAILNITVDGVKKTRTRVRKKLNLPSSTQLENYLKQL